LALSLSEAERANTEVIALLEKKRFPEFCGWIERHRGEQFLYDSCRQILRDTSNTGKIASFIARFPFKSVFTTNFDDGLKRHFAAAGKAIQTFTNSRTDLEAVDIDTVPCIVKVHSDLEHTDTIVLTDSQYSRVRASGDYLYLRDFVKSYLATKRFLIIGYSLSDPNIQLLLEEIAQNIRRQTPIYAIVADAGSDERARIRRHYNIEIIPYRNTSGTHAELVRLFEALSAFVAEAPAPKQNIQVDLHRAQSLYLWSRFTLSPNAPVYLDSLKSIVMSQLAEGHGSIDDLSRRVLELVGLNEEV
jgi:hypothetical protein